MNKILLSLFISFMCSPCRAQSKVDYIKIMDTISLNGYIIYDNRKNEFNMFYVKELTKNVDTYHKIKNLYKHSDFKILDPEFINTPYVFDSSEVNFKKDTIGCKEQVTFTTILNNSFIVYKDDKVTVSGYKISGMFYKLQVLDKFLYSNKHKIKYNTYLAFYCYNYPDRKFLIIKN